MIGRVDFWLAIGAAAGLHVVTLSLWAPGASGGGSGANGTASISVAAVDPALQALVETWTKAPEATDEVERLTEPSIVEEPTAHLEEPASWVPKSQAILPKLPLPASVDKAPPRAIATQVLAAPQNAERVDVAVDRPTPDRVLPRVVQELAVAEAPARLPQVDDSPPVRRELLQAPAPEPRPARPQIVQRVALGSGGGATAGRKASDAVRPDSADNSAAEQARWAAQIQQKIARYQAYPRGARATGRVRVSMVIMQNGALGDVSVANSSGAARLDQAAVWAVQRAAPFPPAPDSLTKGWYRVAQWISFERR